MARQALVVYNPAARRAVSRDKLAPGIEWLRARDWHVELVPTTHANHATELAREAASHGFEAVVGCGGDGTLNEVANGLAGTATPIAAVPGGTANVWAKEARIPRKPADALRLLDEGEVRTIDLGRATLGEASVRYFLLMAGVGLDAAIVRSMGGGLKRRLGAAAYVISGLRHAITHRTVNAELELDGQPQSSGVYWLLLGNTRNYGGLVDITYRAQADDGALDLCLLDRGGLLRLAWLVPWLLLRRHDRRAHVTYRRLRSLGIATPGLPVQVDGEYLGETPVRFEVVPAALRVVVPHGLESELFARDS
jgi:YegS/Rv2252/BmrU family lipid kinase